MFVAVEPFLPAEVDPLFRIGRFRQRTSPAQEDWLVEAVEEHLPPILARPHAVGQIIPSREQGGGREEFVAAGRGSHHEISHHTSFGFFNSSTLKPPLRPSRSGLRYCNARILSSTRAGASLIA